jgi:hypothetical protein
MKSPARDERMVLPSQTGLKWVCATNPALKCGAIFIARYFQIFE